MRLHIFVQNRTKSVALLINKTRNWILEVYEEKAGDNQDYQKQCQDRGTGSTRIKTMDPRVSKESQISKTKWHHPDFCSAKSMPLQNICPWKPISNCVMAIDKPGIDSQIQL